MTTRKGISPVIATVIIVAVTIAVAIAVAFWMTGIIGLFTGSVEKLEIVSLYVQPN
ncbi:MAG: archaellin/type IV pilin N-terminal domain-containing protein, partial [Infirmifilum sp.]|uniref:archaellin/type IV pilin N-terminal domain-containing protein n=1 Tax=Infirmifilum sp. TaxID=2856575 RepID=UPI003D1336E8